MQPFVAGQLLSISSVQSEPHELSQTECAQGKTARATAKEQVPVSILLVLQF